MIHDPCGIANLFFLCMIDNKCIKYFSKKFNEITMMDRDGFLVYRWRNDGRAVEKNRLLLDNHSMVPYNIELLIKYQAHINVECCNYSRSVKYLFKYVNKGSD